MQRSEQIFLLILLFPIGLAAGVQGSRDFLNSTVSLIGIGVFTALLGALLFYACSLDIKHWRKSIDGNGQLSYPSASPADFQLPPLHETSEKKTTVQDTDVSRNTKTTTMERTPQEEKTLRIVKAMYTSSNREVPEAVQKSLQKGPSHSRPLRPATTLQTISEETEKSNRTATEEC